MNRKLKVVTALVMIAVMITGCFYGMKRASAATYEEKLKKTRERKAELEKMLETEKQRKADFEKNVADTKKYINELNGEIDQVMAYIESIDIELQKIYDRIEELNNEIFDRELELEQTKEELEEAQISQQKQYEAMKKRIRHIYENGTESFWDMITGAVDFENLLNRAEYRKKITEYDNSLFERYKASTALVDAYKEYLEESIKNLEELKAEAEEESRQQNELSAKKGEQLQAFMDKKQIEEELLFSYGAEVDKAELSIEDIYKLQHEQTEEEKRIEKEEQERLAEIARKAEEERKKKAAEEAARQKELERQYRLHAAEGVVRTWETSINKMIWPLPGDGRTYSGFGPRKAPCPGASTFHQGVDIGGVMGATIVAVLAGRVTGSSYNSSGGNYVQIDHGNGVSTRYLHMSQRLVKVGDYVMQGQPIGLVGSTGISTGSHLHFGVIINGSYVDPMKYIKYTGK